MLTKFSRLRLSHLGRFIRHRTAASSGVCPKTIHFETAPDEFWASESVIVLRHGEMGILGRKGFSGICPAI